jgi:hypothetical protein
MPKITGICKSDFNVRLDLSRLGTILRVLIILRHVDTNSRKRKLVRNVDEDVHS